MKTIKNINHPNNNESNYTKADPLHALRERILNSVLIGGALIGVFAYFLVVIRTFNRTPLLAAIIYTLVLCWIIIIAFIRKLPYQLRALSLISVIYLLGITSYLQAGVTADGAIFMLTFIVMSSLLLGNQWTWYSLVIAISTIVFVAAMMSMHLFYPSGVFSSDDASGWINRGIVFLMLGIVLCLSLMNMLHGLQLNLKESIELATQLENEKINLRDYTQNLERRSLQIHTAAEISQSMNSVVIEPQKLIQDIVDLIKDRFSLYYVGIFLLDEDRRYAVLNAGTGEPGIRMIGENYKVPIGEMTTIGWVIANRKSRIQLWKMQDHILNPYLPETQSELVFPLVSGDRARGALTIQSNLTAAFDEDDIAIFQTIADTLASALENARLFQATQKSLQELRAAHSQYLTEAWSRATQEVNNYEYSAKSQLTNGKPASVLDIPLSIREQNIGQIKIESNKNWTEDDKKFVEAIAEQTTLALENARLLKESQQATFHEKLVTEITSKIWSSAKTETILQTSVKELGQALHADEATIELKVD